jgi:hypothetical protein
MSVPESILREFFVRATSALQQLRGDEPVSLPESRALALSCQRTCLDEVVTAYNTNNETSALLSCNTVLVELKTLQNATKEIVIAKEQMEDAARHAVCRLALFSQCQWEANGNRPKLKTSGALSRQELVEFIALCDVAVNLPNVRKHLTSGSPLFEDIHLSAADATIFPQKRLESIQRLLMKSIGYDPDHGTAEIQRIFFSGTQNEFSNDEELHKLVTRMSFNMSAAIQNTTIQSMDGLLNDQNNGGCTRVVSVDYSETLIDESTGQVIADPTCSRNEAPLLQTMEGQANERDEKQQWSVARETSRLHQEILGELLSMDDDERTHTLDQAKRASETFLERLAEIPKGPERIEFVQSMDLSTQRLLVMDKLWSSMIESNGGKPPKIHYQYPHGQS